MNRTCGRNRPTCSSGDSLTKRPATPIIPIHNFEDAAMSIVSFDFILWSQGHAPKKQERRLDAAGRTAGQQPESVDQRLGTGKIVHFLLDRDDLRISLLRLLGGKGRFRVPEFPM